MAGARDGSGGLLRPEVIAAIERLDLRAEAVVQAAFAGHHRSPFRGFSVEFSEHRRYVPGDEIRHIDWKLVARTDRVHVKQFEAETTRRGLVLLDASGSMGTPAAEGAPSKAEYARTLAASFAYLLHRQRDPVALLSFAGDVHAFLPARSTRPHLEAIFAALHRYEPDGPSRLTAMAEEVCTRFRHRGTVVVISDLLGETPDDGSTALRRLAGAGHDVVCCHLLCARETRFPFTGPVVLADPETGEERAVEAEDAREDYLERLSAFRERLADAAGAVGADLVACDTRTPFDEALEAVARRRSGQKGRPWG